nr:transcription termination factor Rho [bacterium]
MDLSHLYQARVPELKSIAVSLGLPAGSAKSRRDLLLLITEEAIRRGMDVPPQPEKKPVPQAEAAPGAEKKPAATRKSPARKAKTDENGAAAPAKAAPRTRKKSQSAQAPAASAPAAQPASPASPDAAQGDKAPAKPARRAAKKSAAPQPVGTADLPVLPLPENPTDTASQKPGIPSDNGDNAGQAKGQAPADEPSSTPEGSAPAPMADSLPANLPAAHSAPLSPLPAAAGRTPRPRAVRSQEPRAEARPAGPSRNAGKKAPSARSRGVSPLHAQPAGAMYPAPGAPAPAGESRTTASRAAVSPAPLSGIPAAPAPVPSPTAFPEQAGRPQHPGGYHMAFTAPRGPGRRYAQPGIPAPMREAPAAMTEEESAAAHARMISELTAAGECMDISGVLEVLPDGFGFLRTTNYSPSPGSKDAYISAAQIRKFGLRPGDWICGKGRVSAQSDRAVSLLHFDSINDLPPEQVRQRPAFESLVPIHPDERLTMEGENTSREMAVRLIDMIAPIGRGQRGLIVSPPKAGKTVLLKKLANCLMDKYPNLHLIVLLIDERPEEVTDMQRSIRGEVVYSTFDEQPEHHVRVAEMVLERAKRLVEHGRDVVVLLDSITRLARAYNLTITPTGRSLSGGLDPGALLKPKRFFGAARNIEHGGSLSIIATALVDTGSRMDDIIYEEFKGTGNMELHLDRKLSERRIFPAIDIARSGTRREELLLTPEELEGIYTIRRILSTGNSSEAMEQLTGMLVKTRTNAEFFARLKEWMLMWEKQGYTLGRASNFSG